MYPCKVYLKPKKEESLLRFHPWVFSGAIQSITGKPEEGELVEVFGSNGQFLAVGHYQIGSIAVRVLSFQQQPIDASFWKEGIRVADGGWHFGYMGGHGEKDIKKRVQEKVVSAAHQEYNSKHVLSNVTDQIKDGKDIFGRNAQFVRCEIDDSFP